MLSNSWEDMRHDKDRRSNLFRGLSRIILSLGRIPLPRIGSFTMDNTGALSLTNRPLTLTLQQLENGGIPVNISRKDTYTAMEPYVLDLLDYHDSRLRHQPNSINDDKDCRAQMAAITGMRAVLPHLIQRDTRQGPFSLSLTDLHQSNIYVDKDWHITRIIDLEWACSLPIQMQTPPYWLTSLKVDELNGENLVEYNKVLEEFMEAFEGEEMLHLQQGLYGGQDARPRTSIMRNGWESGAGFYFYALESTTGLLFLWGRNIKPVYSKVSYLDDEANKVLASYWSGDMEDTVVAKLQDRETYLEQLQKLFEAKAESPAT